MKLPGQAPPPAAAPVPQQGGGAVCPVGQMPGCRQEAAWGAQTWHFQVGELTSGPPGEV